MEVVALGADHAGFLLKEEAKKIVKQMGFEYKDFGTHSTESCDYPDYALAVAEAVKDGKFKIGMLFCKTGIGMSICANKVPGIRAALCLDLETARLAREHNDANILVVGAQSLKDDIKGIIKEFLSSSFYGGRHKRRLEKLQRIEALFIKIKS
jgi:ribose 5-phosphate isomerase B